MLGRVFSSPRRRRRLGRLGLVTVGAATVAVVGLHYSTKANRGLPQAHAGAPQLVAPNPRAVPFAPEQAAVEAVVRRFVTTAVFRRHVGQSYDLVTSSLRQDLSRAEWARGAIPVVPYPASAVKSVRWNLGYSYSNRVELRLAFLAKPGARAHSHAFDVELRAFGTGASRHWLVHSWTPA